MDKPGKNDKHANLEAFLESNRDVLDLLDRIQISKPDGTRGDTENLSAAKTAHDFEADHFPIGDLPRNIDRFEIQSLLGQGGYGLVFRAFDPKLKRQVALKVPRPETLLTEELRVRFIREAELAAALSHANIVPVLEAGSAGPICYIVASYVPGRTLQQWIENRAEPVPPVLAAEILIALTDAVQHAHSRDVIHRDLKPDNVLVRADSVASPDLPESTASDNLPDMQITDFGLARSLGETQNVTRSGAVVGTPSYMAPEQINSEHAAVGRQSDIYSLGAILYFVLCGKPPLAGKSLIETIRLVESAAPVPPRSIRREISVDLEAICLKCLEKHPTQRYQTASELQADLVRFVKGLPVLARKPSRLDRAVLWCRRRPAIASLAATLFLVLALSTVVLGFALSRVNSLKQQSDHNAANAVRERDRARDALDAMTSSVASIWLSGQRELSDDQRTFLEETTRYYLQLAEAPMDDGADQFWVGQALHRLARLQSQLGEMDQALDSVDRSIKVLRQVPPEQLSDRMRLELAHALHHKGNFLSETSRIREALPIILEAIALARTLVARDPNDLEKQMVLSMALGNAATRLQHLDRLDESLELQLESMAINEDLAKRFPDELDVQRQLGIKYMNLGNLLTRMRRMDEGADYLEKSLSLRQSLVDAKPNSAQFRSDLAWTLGNLGGLEQRRDELDASESYFTQSADIRRELVQQFPLRESYRRDLVFALSNLLFVLQAKNDLERNRVIVDDLLSTVEKALTDFPDIPLYRIARASAILRQAQLLAANENSEQALEVLAPSLDDLEQMIDHDIAPKMARRQLENSAAFSATTLSELGRHEESIAVWDRAIQASSGVDATVLRLCRATSLVKLDKADEALDALNSILEETAASAEQPHFNIFYNAACIHALLSERSKEEFDSRKHGLVAIAFLEKSIAAGFQQLDRMAEDPELKSIHDFPEFKSLFGTEN